MTKERSRFEKWALDRFYDCSRNAADEYSHVYTVAKWDGWQARAALEDRQEAATTCEKCNSQFEYCVETSGWYCPKCDIRCDGPGVPSEATPSKENAPANLLCDQIDPVTLAEHTKHVEQFLNEMYATMIDPVEQPSMKVSEICALLLKTASEQREQLAAPEVQPDEEDTSTEADLPRYLLMLKLEKERAPEVQGTPTEHAENCEFQPKSAETEQIDCTCVGTPQKETPPSKCNCGSHKLAPLYHHPDCPKCQKTAPVPEGYKGKNLRRRILRSG